MTIGFRFALYAVGFLLLLGCATAQSRETAKASFKPYDGPASCRRVTTVFDEDILQRREPASMHAPMHEWGRGHCIGRGRR